MNSDGENGHPVAAPPGRGATVNVERQEVDRGGSGVVVNVVLATDAASAVDDPALSRPGELRSVPKLTWIDRILKRRWAKVAALVGSLASIVGILLGIYLARSGGDSAVPTVIHVAGPVIQGNTGPVALEGGIAIGPVNVGEPQRHLSRANEQQLVSWMQKEGLKEATVMFEWGDAEARRFATEIVDRLRARGFGVQGPHDAKFGGPPRAGVGTGVGDGKAVIKVRARQ